jgi:ribosomal protein L24
VKDPKPMKPGDRVWSISGTFKGSSGEVVAVDGSDVTVDWDGRRRVMVHLPTLEPEVWLHLHCCDVGRTIGAAWIEGTEVKSRASSTEAAFALCLPRQIFGPDQEAVRVNFCPGCGAPAPKLERREEPTSFHQGPYDNNGNCKTCHVRYCSGEDPSRNYKAV